jgi:acyl-CoA reductase-like NAD-dependent aldehyde dehydrogenase
MVPQLPTLRFGQAYASLERTDVRDYRTGETLAQLSQVSAGLLRKDLKRAAHSRFVMRSISTAHWLEICQKAADLFAHGQLPLGEPDRTQSPQEYVETLSATSGLPHVLVRRNLRKIADALGNMPTVLNGLTRGLDPQILDSGYGVQSGTRVSFFPTTSCLGLVLPSNSPGVNSLWLPAIPLKMPLLLKPGRDEPWTPYRLIQAFIAAGCPAEAFGFYHTDHEGAAEILRSCQRALLFGDQSTTAPYANNPAIQIHGPGHSKILVGSDQIERWPELIDLMAASIADNGGRSCINASTVVVPKYGAQIADALAQRLGPIAPKSASDPDAQLAAFAQPKMADYIDHAIDEGLKSPGASDITARYRHGPRKVQFEGGIYLRPTIVHCESFSHPLANREFLFPYASVVETPTSDMLSQIGPSLVVTAITQDAAFRRALLESPSIDRLNLGPVSTLRVSWDQPHEGNLFEFLYRRRALELDEPAIPAAA